MSFASITAAANDSQLRARVDAAANKEVRYSAELAATVYGQQLLQGMPAIPGMTTPPSALMWGVAVATEAEYETALQAGRGAPGHDKDIITDGAITSAVVANWPPDPPVTNPAMMPMSMMSQPVPLSPCTGGSDSGRAF